MVTVKRFDVLSVGIMSGILYAIFGLVAGLFMAAVRYKKGRSVPAWIESILSRED